MRHVRDAHAEILVDHDDLSPGYSTTQGRASYTMQFDSYEAVPKSVAEEIISKAGGNA